MEAVLEESQGVLPPFFFPFWGHFRETIPGSKVVPVVLPDMEKEIVKSADTGGIPKRESSEDGIKKSFPEHAAPKQ